jgi:hypothetical protein
MANKDVQLKFTDMGGNGRAGLVTVPSSISVQIMKTFTNHSTTRQKTCFHHYHVPQYVRYISKGVLKLPLSGRGAGINLPMRNIL